MIQLHYFASLRERLGIGAESLMLPDGVDTVAGLRRWLQSRGEPWTLVEANDKYHARVKVLRTICERLEECL